ncbi:sensor histidine kinase [Mesoterricola silvestris]|uniref:histidine kinase n=1 Tax=Mesoterricola silvestris TaxID=2927979 RepID=A0AA48GHM8_9BACT|nr:ATP-binding protein [Mesoterricola silvestris]BDU73046.1 hypothetical protein METEAL_22200 [Mesoterricola silvestris]
MEGTFGERLLDRLPEGCIFLDREGRVRYLNAAGAQHLGIPRAGALGRTLPELFPGGERAMGMVLLRACLETGVARHFTGSLTGRETDRLTFTAEPEPEGMLVRTWTTRPRLRRPLAPPSQALRRATGSLGYHSLLANMNSGFHLSQVVRDAEGRPVDLRLLDGNRYFMNYFGFRREDVVGRNHLSLWPNVSRSLQETEMAVALTGLPAHFEFMGELHPIALEVFAFRPAFETVAIFSIEISERKLRERAAAARNQALEARAALLEESVQELDAFGSAIAHDLRAPIRHIAGFADLLASQEETHLTETGRHWLATIRRSAGNMGHLLDHLLALSRSGGGETRRERVDLDAMAALAIDAIGPEIRDRDLVWELTPLPPVTGDPTLLREVLTNLLSNAVKFTRNQPQARIRVAGRVEAGEVLVTVRDNGAGFDPRQAHRLFTVFQRLHTDQQFPGSGVGLASIKRSIRRMGGRVWAEAPEGGGAVFGFALPGIINQ